MHRAMMSMAVCLGPALDDHSGSSNCTSTGIKGILKLKVHNVYQACSGVSGGVAPLCLCNNSYLIEISKERGRTGSPW